MRIVMIATIRSGRVIKGIRLIDADSGHILDVSRQEITQKLSEGVSIENLELSGDNLLCSMGEMAKYGKIRFGDYIVLESSLVVLSMISESVYKVCDAHGRIEHMELSSIHSIIDTTHLSNAEFSRQEDGQEILRGIGKEIAKDALYTSKQYGAKLKLKNNVLAAPYEMDERYFAYLAEGNKEESIFIGKGCLGIRESGFRNTPWLKEIILPPTLEIIEPYAFMCSGLEKIKIPEGIKVIPDKCFAGCVSLKEVELPNSLQTIQRNAFLECHKLKTIFTGPIKIEIAFGAVPRGVRRVIRK